jgi:GNAT superfamily N-acetyltransferase
MAPDQLLTAPDGRPLARYQRRLADDDRPMADLVELVDGVEEAEAVPALMAAFAGWRVGAAPPLARALVAAGARTHRHAHVMSRDLRGDPAPAAWLEPQLPRGFRLTAVGDRRAGDLAPVAELAYPPGHPDHRPEPEVGELEAIMSGRLLGPLLPCSALVIGPDGDVAGAVLVNDSDGGPPFGGPWLSQVFRHPDAPGLGTALLRRALAAGTRDGVPAIGLAVTHANPARARYAALGFAEVIESLSVDV